MSKTYRFKPFACALISLLGSIVLSPALTQQGMGVAISLQGLLDARARGYRVGVLQSSEMGYNVYRRLGFESLFKIKTYAPAQA